MKKRGFTLIELIAIIVILAIILAIAIPSVTGIIRKTQEKACLIDAGMMEKAARQYVSLEGTFISEGSSLTIPLLTLQTKNYISAVYNPADRTTECEGYVVVSNNGTYQYKAYLKCSNVCQTAGYDGDLKNPDLSDDLDTTIKNGAKYFVGANPNNWVKFGRIDQQSNYGILWRIIKIDDTGIKMVYEGLENDGGLPVENGRILTGGTMGIAWDTAGTNLWENPATLKARLDNWMNGIYVIDINNYVSPTNWKIGGVPYEDPTKLETFLNYEGIDSTTTAGSFKGLTSDQTIIGMSNPSDFISTSSNTACTSSYRESGSGNECAFDLNGSLNNWLYKSKYHWWTMNARSDLNNKTWIINNAGQISTSLTNSSVISVRPVINIKKDLVYYDGNGTLEDPFVLEPYMVGLSDKPVLTLNGTTPTVMREGDPYIELGAKAIDEQDGDITYLVQTTSNLNINVPGDYTITYNVTDSDGNKAIPITRTVTVVEKDRPVLNFKGTNPMYVTLNHTYVEPGATAWDLNDGDISSKVVISGTVNTAILGTYDVKYNVTNSQNKAAVEITRKVIVEVPKPVITLKGEANMLLEIGDAYVEQGATAFDEVDGDLTDDIEVTLYLNGKPVSAINSDDNGYYKIKYQVTNSLGGTTTEYRYVNVVDAKGPTITFDSNGDKYPKQTNETKVTVTANKFPVKTDTVNYLWVASRGGIYGKLEDIIKNPFKSGDTIKIAKGTDYYYLYTIAKDTYQNTTIARSNYFLIDNSRPAIYLNGSSIVNILIHGTYTDAGATAWDEYYDGNLTSKIQVSSDVNTEVVGTYFVTYTVTDRAGNTTTVKRRVNVNYSVPVIKLNGYMNIDLRIDTPYVDQGATATDPIDGNISSKIIATGYVDSSKAGIYYMTYSVTNSFGVTTTSVRTVNVYIPKPVINIIGGNKSILLKSPYTDQGATATDEIDGDLTSKMITTGTVNPNVLGTYYITYSVTNSHGANTTVRRSVTVREPKLEITPNGNNPYDMEVGEAYVELGAKAIDEKDGDISSKITMTSNLNPNVVGNYYVTYSVTDSVGVTARYTRTIRVLPLAGPSISIVPNGNSTWKQSHIATITVTETKKPIDPATLKYMWSDSAFKPLADDFTLPFTNGGQVKSPDGVTGRYYLYVLAKDVEGNTSILRSNLFNIDNTPPVITLNGLRVYEVPVDGVYDEPGATVFDEDSKVKDDTIIITGNVVPSILGTYTVTYDATDNAGNKAITVKRTVVVREVCLTCSIDDFVPRYYADYFVGSNPNNWIEFGEVSRFDDRPYLWRIVKSDKEGIKIIYEGIKKEDNTVPDEGGRIRINGALYSPFDKNNSNLWDTPVTLASQLQDWYNSIYEPDKDTLVAPINWCIGGIKSPYTIDDFKATECTTVISAGQTFPGRTSTTSAVGLLNTSDYLLTSTGRCDAYNSAGCGTNNYLARNYNYITNNVDAQTTTNVFEAKASAGLGSTSANVNSSIRPVVNLKSDVLVLSGEGTLDLPYKLNTRVPIVDHDPPVITFTPNESTTYQSTYKVEIVAADILTGIQEGTLKYVWTTSATQPAESAITNDFVNGDQVSIPTGASGTYYLWAMARDNKNNLTIKGSGAFKLDILPPVITLIGDNPSLLEKGSVYSDAGVTATDNIDGNITNKVQITSNVNPSVVGTYTVTYTVTDTAGNKTVVTREVIVDVPGPLADKIAPKLTVKNGNNYFVGVDPSNWIEFGQVSSTNTTPLMWRIISSDSTGIKIVYEGVKNGTSKPTANGNLISREWNSSSNNNKWETPSTMKNYLYNWYANSFYLVNKDVYVNPVKWCIGGTTSPYAMSTECQTLNAAGGTFAGLTNDYTPIGLINGSDYISTTSATTCTNGSQTACGTGGNFLFKGYEYWTLNAYNANTSYAWFIGGGGSMGLEYVSYGKGTRPVINLRNDVMTLIGTGTLSNPYKLKPSPAPSIRIVGDNPLEIFVGETYSDPGVIAIDDKDGNITNKVIVTGTVNPNVAGKYTITYNVTDSNGNMAPPVTRTIKVLGETLLAEKISPSLTVKNGSSYFTGANPNNWVQFGQVSSTDTTPLMWRIIKSNSGGIQIIYEGAYNINLPPNANGNLISREWHSSSGNNKWETPSTMKTYLSSWFNNSLVQSNKMAYVNPVKWCIGGVTSPYDVNTECQTLNTSGGTFTGMTNDYSAVGLISGRDYISTSSSTSCTNGSQTACGTGNFLFKGYEYWTINAYNNNSSYAWFIGGSGNMGVEYVSYGKATRPVINLRTDIVTLKGDGSLTNPYKIRPNSEPYLRLVGNDTVEVMLYDQYTDAGVTAVDDKDADIASRVQMTSNVNINVAGTYYVTYNVKDSDGYKAAPVTRTVKVLGETLLADKISPSLTTKNGSNYFTGSSPNNWIQFGQASSTDTTPLMWRIISSDVDGIKIIYEGVYNINLTPIANGNLISREWHSSSGNNKWETPSTMKTYLASWFNNTLVQSNKTAYVNPIKWCVGGVNSPYDMNTECQTLNTNGGTFVGMTNDYSAIGLINGRDYISTSISSLCTNGSQTACGTGNFLFKGYEYWTMNAYNANSSYAWFIGGSGNMGVEYVSYGKATRPVVNLRADIITLKGDGSLTDPYKIRPNAKPYLRLIGDSEVSVMLYDSYNDPGIYAYDDKDGNISSKVVVTSNVNTSRAGTYTVTYNVTDSNGLRATPITRTVKVLGETLLVDKMRPSLTTKNGSDYFTGANPNNWIQFGQVSSSDTTPLMWRIISSNNDGVKIIYEGVYNINLTPIANGNLISREWHSASSNNKWQTPSTMKNYLSGWFNSTLVQNNKTAYVNPTNWCIGGVTSPYDMSTECQTLNTNGGTFTGITSDYSAVGLINGSDYISTSSSTSCTNGSQTACGTGNFLFKGYEYWTINAYNNNSSYAWFIGSGGNMGVEYVSYGKATRPVVNLRADTITLKGDGSLTNPYIIRPNARPYLRLVGNDTAEVMVYGQFNDPGIYAYDDKDGNISGNVISTSNVNVNVPGTYTVTYNVTDSNGNSAIPITRTVKVLGETPLVNKIASSLVSKNNANYFVGANPNNWVQFGQVSSTDATPLMWRIISSETDGIKIIYEGVYNINLTPIANGNLVSREWHSSSGNNKWETPSTMKSYLANWFNNVLFQNNKTNYVNPVKWCIGGVTSPYNVSTECQTLSAGGGTFSGLTADYSAIGLINGSDYISTSASVSCTNGSQTACGTGGNFLFKGYEYWTMNAYNNNSSYAWFIGSGGNMGVEYVSYGKATRPVVNLRPDIVTLKGDGSLTNPYIIRPKS